MVQQSDRATAHTSPPVDVAQHVLYLDVLLEQLVLGTAAQCQTKDLARSVQPLGTDLKHGREEKACVSCEGYGSFQQRFSCIHQL